MNLLTTSEASEILRISPQTLRRLHVSGKFPAIIVHGKQLCYPPDVLEQYLLYCEQYTK